MPVIPTDPEEGVGFSVGVTVFGMSIFAGAGIYYKLKKSGWFGVTNEYRIVNDAERREMEDYDNDGGFDGDFGLSELKNDRKEREGAGL